MAAQGDDGEVMLADSLALTLVHCDGNQDRVHALRTFPLLSRVFNSSFSTEIMRFKASDEKHPVNSLTDKVCSAFNLCHCCTAVIQRFKGRSLTTHQATWSPT